MTKKELFEYCLETYGDSPDYPFENDFETAVLRHPANKKWYALVMRVSRSKLGEEDTEIVDVVNLKVPLAESFAFDAFGGVYPAYHMNKRHWVSVILSDTPTDLLLHLLSLSYDATKPKLNPKKNLN